VIINRKIVSLTILAMLLAILDVGFTLCHIHWANGVESNPFMKWILDSFGSIVFIGTKTTITGIGVLIFAWQYEKVLWAKIALWSVVTIHIVLAIYHFYLAVSHWK